MKLLAATANRSKFRELETIAARFGVTLVHPEEIGIPPVVEETGETYLENAMLKAKSFCEWSKIPSLGDDSGLEVDALGGAPGVRSARFAPNDRERIAKLVEKMKGVEDRSAKFRCVLVLYRPDGSTLSAEGVLNGRILHEPRGRGGFGYDPIVLIDEFQQTLAEVDFSVTCDRGFRARAAQALFTKLTAEAKR